MKRLIILAMLLAFPAAADELPFMKPATLHVLSADTTSTIQTGDQLGAFTKYIKVWAEQHIFLAFGTSTAGAASPVAANTGGDNTHFVPSNIWSDPIGVRGTWLAIRASDTSGMVYIQEMTK